jgi:CHAT domain-containing protein
VVCLPSATALRARRGGPPPNRPAGKVLAVFADPVFSPSDARVTGGDVRPAGTDSSAMSRDASLSEEDRSGTAGGNEFPRLPFSRAEAGAIARLAPAGTVWEALDFQASRSAALDPGLGEYAYIHFATHGLLDSGRPERSGLVLSLVDERGRPQEGVLRLADIYGLRLPARLVALSACQTALGRDVRGEGLLSLTRGFMYAGAERVLASLWKVDDEATARLMEEFYRRVLGPSPLPPARALQEAQRAIRRQKRWSAPYFWAGFVLQGEWRGDRP